jgi:hypothetical protein
MTKFSFVLILSLLTLVGCTQSSKKSTSNSSGSNLSAYCALYPTDVQCTGSTTGSSCSGTDYYNVQGCAGYCSAYPTSTYCTGTTTGTTTGSASSCTGKYYYCSAGCAGYSTANAATTYCSGYADTVSSINYGVKYPGGTPTGSCSAATAPTTTSGVTYYEPRTARVMIAGGHMADPTSSEAASQINTDPEFMYLSYAKSLFISDAVLKVRFKINPQPEVSKGSVYCYGRATGQATTPGYTQLKYTVTVKGYDAAGNMIPRTLGTYVTGVNSCTSAVDLSSIRRLYPNGMYLTITDVQGNQDCTPTDAAGYSNCQAFKAIRAADCWTLDVQVAGDDTKTF